MDQALLDVAMAHGRAMVQSCAAALVANGECAPMFAVLGPDGRSLAAGIFAAFKDDDEKVAKHRALAEFASTQRAAAVVTCFDAYLASYDLAAPTVEHADGTVRVAVDDVRPSERADAREGLQLEVMTAEGVVQPVVIVEYRRGDAGEVTFDEPRQETFTAIGEGLSSLVRGLRTAGQRESRSTATRRLANAGFVVMADPKEADTWLREN